MGGVTVDLHFTDLDAENRFVESYLADAWSRFESADFWEHGWFWTYGQFIQHDIGLDGGLVRLVFEGDLDGLLDAEADRWDAFEGFRSWDSQRYDNPTDVDTTYDSLLAQQRDAKGPDGGDREYRYKPITATLALEFRREFAESIPAAPDRTDDSIGIGMWSLMHAVFVQCGYDWYDETDACLRAMQNRLKSIAHYRGESAAREEYERLREAWEAHEAELDDWLAANPTGEASEP